MQPRSAVDEVVLLGHAESMEAIRTDVDCATKTDAKVLITGETGVGKEIVARYIHARSARATSSLVTINCAGIPDSLLESELFGHTRGSFTGAYRDRAGLLELASNGTLFLDEVGEMSTRMQAVLLRFLETGEVQRIGATRSHTCADVRLITATNRDLSDRIAAGAFREDLYYRLNVIRIAVPPLRERRTDIPLFVRRFVDDFSRQHHVEPPAVTPAVLDAFVAYRWPGNVRELRNVIERLVLRSSGRALHVSDLPADICPGGAAAAAPLAVSGAHTVVDRLTGKLLNDGESFWSAVYPEFMARDITRDDLRALVRIGLERSNGSYRVMVSAFNMPSTDYKRFLAFLRKHDCHLPFQRFRTTSMRGVSDMRRREPVAADR